MSQHRHIYLLVFLVIFLDNTKLKQIYAGENNTAKSWNLLESLSSDCGKSHIIIPKGYHGREIVHGEAPWNAALISKKPYNNFFCGGTLISSKFVITAAHCIEGKQRAYRKEKTDFFVSLGGHNLSIPDEKPRIECDIEEIHIHKDWIPEFQNYDADIALLELVNEVHFNRYIQPICLLNSDSPASSETLGYVTGFGESERVGVENVARRVETPIHSYEKCGANSTFLQDLMSRRLFCGGYADGTGVCTGDSGSGLIVVHENRHYLRGVVSASVNGELNSCNLYEYSMFTDALGFYGWIVMGKDNREWALGSIIKSPKIKPFQEYYFLKQGTDFEIVCNVTGFPCPEIIWSNRGNKFGANAQQVGNKLKIVNITVANSGRYVCTAINTVGSDRAFLILNIQVHELPVIKIYPKTTQKILVDGSSRILFKNESIKCGKRNTAIGSTSTGSHTRHGEFPWNVVLMRTTGQFYCGGTLVSKRHVVTAANCIFAKNNLRKFRRGQFSVLLGVHNYSKSEEFGRISEKIKSIQIHPHWNPYSRNFDADIAILEIKNEVQFNYFIQPICIADKNSSIAQASQGIVIGFEIITDSNRSKTKSVSDVAKKLEIPIHNYQDCIKNSSAHKYIASARMFCGGPADGRGVCSGDAGGGVYVLHNGQFYLRGITSATLRNNKSGCDVDREAIFTDATKFHDWINREIGKSN